MRNAFFPTMLIWFVMFAFAPNIFSQDVLQEDLPEDAIARFGRGKGTINEIQFSPDGTHLAVASSIGIWLYDAETGQDIALLKGHTDVVWSVSFSPDGETLASGGLDDTVRLWDVGTGQPLQTLSEHESAVLSVVFSPDGRLVASSGFDGTVLLWEPTTTRPESKHIAEDVNKDGIVNILDLVAVANAFGTAHPDINGDGIVNVLDLVAVANAFE